MPKKLPKKKKKASLPLEDDVKKLAARIKELRIEKGYTSYEYFAYDNNISPSQFGRYERGTDIRYRSLLKVIRALGVTPVEFFKGIE
jgi:transcriptional regulator with XRE-family HTH domain